MQTRIPRTPPPTRPSSATDRTTAALCAALIGGRILFSTSTTKPPVHWETSQVALQIDPAVEKLLPPGKVRLALETAAQEWRSASTNAPDIVIANGAPKAFAENFRHNGIYLSDNLPPKTLALTYFTYASVDHHLIGVDVLVNAHSQFADLQEAKAGAEAYDFQAMITHELGHVLGLPHSPQRTATMFPEIASGETQQRTLEHFDQQAVRSTYAEVGKTNVLALTIETTKQR